MEQAAEDARWTAALPSAYLLGRNLRVVVVPLPWERACAVSTTVGRKGKYSGMVRVGS